MESTTVVGKDGTPMVVTSGRDYGHGGPGYGYGFGGGGCYSR